MRSNSFRNFALCLPSIVIIFLSAKQGYASVEKDSTQNNLAINFGLGNSQGVILQYWLNNHSALLSGVVLSSGTQLNNPMTPINPFEILRFGIYTQYRYYFLERRNFAPFLGAGTSISWQQSRQANAVSYDMLFSAGVSIGIECFILPWLSVTGQIGVGANYSYYSIERPINSIPSHYANQFRMNLGTNELLVSIYFQEFFKQ